MLDRIQQSPLGALVLGRKKDQAVVIATPQAEISVEVVHVGRSRVRLLVRAPREYPAFRRGGIHDQG